MAFGLKVRWVSRWPGNKASLPLLGGRGEGVVIVVNSADFSYDEYKVWDQSCLSSWRRQSFVKRQTQGWCWADKSTLSRNTFVRFDPGVASCTSGVSKFHLSITTIISDLKKNTWEQEIYTYICYRYIEKKLSENISNSNIIYSVHLRHVFGTHNEHPWFKL